MLIVCLDVRRAKEQADSYGNLHPHPPVGRDDRELFGNGMVKLEFRPKAAG